MPKLNGVDSSRNYPYAQFDRAEMLDLVPRKAATILDLGCGTGGFGIGARARDPDVVLWGAEIDPSAAALASEHYDRVLVGPVPEVLSECAQTFDCIVANDILEHLTDPWLALSCLTRLLSSGGVVVASIPNIRYLPVVWDLAVRGRWEYTETGTLDRTHLRFFTRRSIVILFQNCGLEIEHITGINSIGAIGARRWRAACRLLPPTFGDMRFLQFAVVAHGPQQ